MTSPDDPLYPLKLQPIYKEKVWGGRSLARLGKALPGGDDTPIGESWELADFGQDGGESVITNGPAAGMTLHDAVELFGERLLGRLHLNEHGRFPLLLKYLDTSQPFSVQVHPGPQHVDQFPGAVAKHEAWYIIDAADDAVLYKGFRPGVTAEQFRQAIDSGSRIRIEQLLNAIPARPDTCHYLPGGTCHALGAGVLVAEVQTPSDTTFRLYDWGRTERQLHVEQAMQCLTFGPLDVAAIEKRTHIANPFTTVSRLVGCEHFRIEKVRMSEDYAQEIPYDQPAVWMVLEGAGCITTTDADPVAFTRSETLLIPAAMAAPKVRLDADTSWLEVTFPQALNQELA